MNYGLLGKLDVMLNLASCKFTLKYVGCKYQEFVVKHCVFS